MSLLKYFHPEIVFETGTEAPTVKIFHSRNSSLMPPSVVNYIYRKREKREVLYSHAEIGVSTTKQFQNCQISKLRKSRNQVY